MLYKKRIFSVPATEGKGDCSQGHAMLDKQGKCIRCGEQVDRSVMLGDFDITHAHVFTKRGVVTVDLTGFEGEDGG